MPDDDRLRTALLAASDDLEVRPTLVDDVRRGARRRRRRQMWYAAAGVTAVIVLASSVTAYGYGHRPLRHPEDPAATAAVRLPTSCQADALPLPGGSVASLVTGGDRSGRYLVGRAADAQGKLTVLVWHDGKLVTTASMPGDDGTLDDINSAGVAVGNSVTDGGGNTAWLFRDGEFTELTVPGGTGTVTATAAAIGEQGTVVGWREETPGVRTPVAWQPGQTEGTQLELNSTSMVSGQAVDVDADGTIVGQVYHPLLSNAGAVWRPGGKPELLRPMKQGGNEVRLLPTSISGGVIAGRAGNPDGAPTVLDLRTGAFTMIDQLLGAGTMNRMGWFAGRTGNGLGLVAPTGSKPLTAPAPTDTSSKDTLIKTLSDDGLVIGGQTADAGGNTRAVSWRCK